MPLVWVPALMQDLSHGQSRVSVPGSSVRQVIENLDALYPGFKDRLLDGDRLRPNIAVAVDGQVTPRRLRHPLAETSEVHFLPAISGGKGSAREKPDHLGLERLVFFSDAVFAIAITLLALDIRLPAAQSSLTNLQLANLLQSIWPKYMAYAISFLVIGGFWIGHHRRFRFIERYDTNLLLINLFLLMAVAFIPFPTSILSEYGNRTATIFYALSITAAGLLSTADWVYASYHNRLIDPHMTLDKRRRESLRTLVVPAIFMISIGVSFINEDLAKYTWLLIIPVLRLV
jgi:uncharacterized membrane protein/molybdopterin converting factor small subunit